MRLAVLLRRSMVSVTYLVIAMCLSMSWQISLPILPSNLGQTVGLSSVPNLRLDTCQHRCQQTREWTSAAHSNHEQAFRRWVEPVADPVERRHFSRGLAAPLMQTLSLATANVLTLHSRRLLQWLGSCPSISWFSTLLAFTRSGATSPVRVCAKGSTRSQLIPTSTESLEWRGSGRLPCGHPDGLRGPEKVVGRLAVNKMQLFSSVFMR